MDRLTSVQWLRMKADGFYNVYEQERFTEAADEIERLREEVAEWKQAANAEASERRKSHDEIERLRKRVKELATALEFEANYDGHIALARSALQQKDSE